MTTENNPSEQNAPPAGPALRMTPWGEVVPVAPKNDVSGVPDGKTFKSLGEFNDAMRRRRANPPVWGKGTEAQDAAMSEALGRVIADAKANPEPESAQPDGATDDGLTRRDPWDMPGAVQQHDPNDPLSPFRAGQPVPLAMPASVTNYSEVDEANLTDFGHVASREGWSPEFAQALVDQAAADFRSEKVRPGPEGYDANRTVTELRWEWGAETEVILGRVEAFCARRPALSAFLDATGLGNSPAIIRMLAAVASDESIITKDGAKKFVDNLGKNDAYWSGSKLEVAKSRIAFMLADSKH